MSGAARTRPAAPDPVAGPAAAAIPAPAASFGSFVRRAHAAGQLVVQPRMGLADPALMRAGLAATKAADATTVGTITLDSYTRIADHAAARRALDAGADLNGFPLVAHGPAVAAALLDGVRDSGFPVQIRHGSAVPRDIVVALARAGLDATEGGPVSYCLPYGRTPLAQSVRNWAQSCELLAALAERGGEPHLETFGGCMLGQLCPPSLLVAISVLEALFFAQHGLRSVSLSYAQQTHPDQDHDAVAALRRLAGELLGGLDWHIVVYTYMGVFPRTGAGALALLEDSARLAVHSGAARLIVKTVAEAHRIPTVQENVQALEAAAAAAARARRSAGPRPPAGPDTEIYAEARVLIEAVLNLDPDLGRALTAAFGRGHLDVPFCLHPDNAGRARSYLDEQGRLLWSDTGSMPIRTSAPAVGRRSLSSADLLTTLTYVERRYDSLDPARPGREPARPRRASPSDPQIQHTHRESWPSRRRPTVSDHLPASPREHLSEPSTRHTLLVQNAIVAAAREYLTAEGFVELLPPIIGPVTDPGGRGSKQVDVDFYGHRYKLMTSAILYKQASLLAFEKIFCIAPNVRLEPLETCNTNRHLAEFHQIDVEISGATREDAMTVAEGIVTRAVRRVLAERAADLEALGRDTAPFAELLDWPFDRMTHATAVADLRGLGYGQSADAEIDWRNEEILSAKASRPFFVTDYPKGSRGFYDRESRTEPGRLRNFDLIAAEGYGELASGSEREFEYARIVTRIRESGENPAKYGWYLDMVREGISGSAGFGIGLERLTRYVAGLTSVWQASAYPKVPGVVSA
jgi:methylaspartate mutase epsilon subunit